MQITSENFIDAVKCKNEKALEYILDEYGWIIKTVVKKHLYNFESYQEECMNDILMGIWSNIECFDPKRSTFKNWVAGISKYKALSYVRKYIKEVEYENLDNIQIVEQDQVHKELIKNELDENISKMLNQLRPEDQELFIKLYVEEQDISEVSEYMGMKPSAIYNRVSRAKKNLRMLFNSSEGRR